MPSRTKRAYDLRIHIGIALISLGREHIGATKGMTVEQMEDWLAELRREQIGKKLIKTGFNTS